ncbi:adenosine deaminase/editase [Poronia punctata]|nr:adenosine deaminase/editase [Poronia punctata]
MPVSPDLIASLVQQEFDKLPAKRKPVLRANGLREWVPLSGIVAEGNDGKITCLALATGMKCLPTSKLPTAQGNVLHDWHAETLAIRAFNRFILDECQALASGVKTSSDFIRRRSDDEIIESDSEDSSVSWHRQPFTWREDVLLHMYCSEAPCGDASMELTMSSQPDATPWTIPIPIPTATSSSSDEPSLLLLGRGYFSQLGIVRRKPSRSDAPVTLSKSCSDKLSLHQCTSLLCSITSLLVAPDNAYISTLILPQSQYSASGCQRAFSDNPGQEAARMAPLRPISSSWTGGYKFHPFLIKTTNLEFEFSRRRRPQATPNTTPKNPKITPSNISTALTASGQEETTLNGVLQGRKASNAHILGASFASRRHLWITAVTTTTTTTTATTTTTIIKINQEIRDALYSKTEEGQMTTYADVKNSLLLDPRRRVKEDARTLALKGWVRNLGDEDFVLREKKGRS